MHNQHLRLPVALGPVLLLVLSSAQAAEQSTEREFLEEVPLVLTASRLRQPLDEVPVTMTVIDRATIEASGLRNIADLFRLVPGMYVGHGHGIEGIIPVVSYHGMTDEFSRRMQVLIDGRSVYTPLFGTVWWDDMPIAIDDVERIEITRGPNAASYGSNAFFGTINIITRAPSTSDPDKLLARIGQANVREGLVQAGGIAGSVNYGLTLGYKQGQEFVNVYDMQRHTYLAGRAELSLTDIDVVEFQAGLSEGARNQGFYASLVDRPRTKNIDDAYVQINWRHAISTGEELSLQYDYQRVGWEESEQTLPLPLPGLPLQSYFLQGSVQTDSHELDFQDITEVARNLRLVWGLGARMDQIAAPTYFGGSPYESSNVERIFAHAEWRAMANFLLQSGAMVERTSIDGVHVTPRICATYHIDPEQSIRTSISRATRTPLLYEERGNYGLDFASFHDQIFLAPGPFHSEEIQSVELGYHAQFARPSGSLDVKAYRDHASQPLTGSEIHITGLETEAHVQMGGRDRLLMTHAYTVIQSNEVPGALGLDETMPRNLYSLLDRHQFGQSWAGTVAFYFSDRLTPAGGEGSVGTARRLDVRFAYSGHIFSWSSTFAFGVQSALGSYEDFRPDNIYTRRAYVEIIAKP